MKNSPFNIFTVLLITFAIVLPKILPNEIKQLLTMGQWESLTHFIFLIISLYHLRKGLSNDGSKRNIKTTFAAILFLVALTNLLQLIVLPFPAAIVLYLLWSVSKQMFLDKVERQKV